ncbi:MAG: pyrroline-5-carboxylate reductase [Verrucomicrobia bacterium]|nr:pyrroline-5-carboxylate reductase [Verrucomicrobiota bacterium]
MSKIAFLGAGRMASAIVDGLLAKQVRAPADLACNDGGDGTAAALAARTGVAATSDLAALIAPADTLVLACKPQQLAGLDPRLAELAAGKLVLSILAGKRVATLAKVFPRARNLVRAMPNTPGQIGAGISAWCAHGPLAPADRAIVDAILGALGQVVEIGEAQLDAVTGVSGSGPAYVFEFTAALRDAGVAAGLPRDIAWKLATETVLGSARLMARTGTEPETLRDQVTSPNGTTFAGLQRMAARDFRGTIKETVLAATARSVELSRDA